MKTSNYLAALAGVFLVGTILVAPGASLKFDGVDDYVRVEDSAALDLTANYTLECWFRAETFGGLRGLVSKFNSAGANGYLLRLNGTSLDFDGMVAAVTNLQAGVWHHVAAVNSNGTRYLYFDGSPQALTGTPVSVQINADPVCLGRDYLNGGGRVLNGQLDEVRIWNAARSEEELAAWRNRRLTGTETNLVACYSMEEGTGIAIGDNSGNSHTGTLYAGVIWNTAEDAVAPVVLTQPAELLPGPGARLNALVNPSGGASTTNRFLWGAGSTALDLNGIDDSVMLPGDFNAYPLTVTAWIKTSKAGGTGGIVNKYVSSSANGWQLRIMNGRLRAWFFANSGNYVWDQAEGLDGGNVDDGKWHHVAFTVGRSSGKLYVDGVVRAARGWTGTPGPSTTAEPVRLGLYAQDHFAGQIDEVTIWRQELSQPQIIELQSGPPGLGHPHYAQLLGYWAMDGDTTDALGLNSPGIVTSSPFWAAYARPVCNVFTAPTSETGSNAVLNLDGIDDYVDVPDGVWFDGDFTIEAWVYARSHNSWSRVIDFGNGAPSDNVILVLAQSTTGRPNLTVYRGAVGQSVTAPDPIPLNQWAHLAATLAGSQATIYVNGVPVVAGTVAPPNRVTRVSNYVGRSLWTQDAHANYLMDDLRIWNVARTADEIRQCMNAPVVPNTTNLVLNYLFDETDGTTVVNAQTSTPADGTLMNAAGRLTSDPASALPAKIGAGRVYHVRGVSEGPGGTSLGAPVRFATPSPGAGTALEFDGADDLVRVADLGSRLPGTEMTVEFWARVNRLTGSPAIFSLEPDQGANRFLVHLGRTDNRLYWDFGDITAGGRLYYDFGSNISGQWEHFAFTASQSKQSMKIYRNGVEIVAARQFNDFAPGDYDLILGRGFSGVIEEFRIWNQAREGAEIRAMMNQQAVGDEPGLLVCYHMNEGTGVVMAGANPNSPSGLLVNGPVWLPSAASVEIPLAITLPASFVTEDTVKVNGLINRSGMEDTAWFEWGTGTNYDQVTSVTNLAPGFLGETPVAMELTALAMEITYHCRLVASNSFGVRYGQDRTFRIETVSSLADSGSGSLRQAVLDAPAGTMLLLTNSGTNSLTSGEIIINKDLTLVGPGATNLAISGSGSSRVFNVTANSAVNISGVTIRDGRSAGGGASVAGAPGGGIYNAGDLTLVDCLVTENMSGNGGSGNAGGTGAAGGVGGAGGNGGGIYNASTGRLDLHRCTVSFNASGNGGNGGDGGHGPNSSGAGGDGGPGGAGGAGGAGAGIFNDGSLLMAACTCEGNLNGNGGNGGNGGGGGDSGWFWYGRWGGSGGSGGAGGFGGAVFQNAGITVAQNCTISGNSNGSGGNGGNGGHAGSGGWGDGGAGSAAGGGAGGSGGGLYAVGGIELSSCTVAYNRGGAGGNGGTWPSVIVGRANGTGGGIYGSAALGTATSRNTIFGLNLDGSGWVNDAAGSLFSGGGNLVAVSSGAGFAAELGDLLNVPPLLTPLADNGGPTRTHALWPESPAIDAGVNIVNLSTDQRGHPRVACDGIDIGAFEYEDCPPPLHPAALKTLYFDGINDYVQGAEISLSNSFTIEAWAKRDWIGTPDCIVSLGSSDLFFGFHQGNTFGFDFASLVLESTNFFTDTEWHHWAGTYDTNGGIRLIYLDGELVASNRSPAFTGTGALRIGARANGTDGFNGEIDEIRVWKVARTALEIRENSRRALSGTESNLVAYYRFDEAGGSRTRDSVTGFEATLSDPVFVNSGAPLHQPMVTTLAATSVRATTATLNGRVNPAGPHPVTVWVEYGTSLYFGSSSAYAYLDPGLVAGPVSFALTNLESGTKYYYRVGAANNIGTVYGATLSFDTLVVGNGYPISTRANNGQNSGSPKHITDAEGNIYLAGTFTGSIQFKETLQASGSPTNAFLAKLARRGDWRWAASIPVSTDGQVRIHALALENGTNVLIAGAFSGSASFGTNVLESPTGTRAFIARFSPAATNFTWAIALGGGTNNSANAVQMGPDGAIYVAGHFSGTTLFGTNSVTGGSVSLSANGASDAFVARFNADGEPEWATKAGGTVSTNLDSVTASAIGPFGEIYVTGFYMDQGVFGMQTLPSAGGADVFFAALNLTNGLIQRAVRAGGAADDFGTALAVHPNGTVFLAAQMMGAAEFDGSPLPELDSAGLNLVVAQLNRQGVLSRRAAARAANGRSLAIGPNGSLYLGGDFAGVMRYGPALTIVGSGTNASSDVFLARLTEANDNLAWGDFKQIGGIGPEMCGSVSADSAGSVVISGTYAQTLHLGYVELSTPNSREIFIARVDEEGVYEHNRWEIGEALIPPDEALDPPFERNQAKGFPRIEILKAPEALQDSSDLNSFFWNETEKRLYALRPVTARIKWPLSSEITNLANVATTVGRCFWPDHPNTNVAGVPVEVQGPGVGRGLTFADVAFNTNEASVMPVTRGTDQFQVFQTSTNAAGYNVVRYTAPDGGSIFDVVLTRPYGSWAPVDNSYNVGQPLSRAGHQDSTGKNGYVLYERSFYDGLAHDRATRTGPILPVNRNLHNDPTRDLVVAWYRTNSMTGVAWGADPVRYIVNWPADAAQIVIAAATGQPAGEDIYPQAHVYHQPDAALAGFNPNEEHALTIAGRLYALRCDLNDVITPKGSEPYVLLKYLGPDATNDWRIKVFHVVAEDDEHTFANFTVGEAGLEVQLPAPLSLLPLCASSNRIVFGHSQAHQAWNGKIFAKSAGYFQVQLWYPTMPDFYFGPTNPPVGSCVPWMSQYAQAQVSPGTDHVIGDPVCVGYHISWPQDVPRLASVETLTTMKGRLPDLFHFSSARIIYDDGNPNTTNHLDSLVRIFDPISERTVQLAADFELPDAITKASDRGRWVFPDLPYALRIRLFYDELNQRLSFGGWYDETGTGEPLLLPNILSPRERDRIKQLDGTNTVSEFDEEIDRLYDLTRNPNQVDVDGNGPDTELRVGLITQIRDGFNEILIGPVIPGPTNNFVTYRTNVVLGQPFNLPITNIIQEQFGPLPKALTAGLRPGSGYITLVENDDPDLPGQLIGLHVMFVTNRLYRGDLKVLPSDNVFDERLTMRHSGDFAGEPQNYEFEWYYQPDQHGVSPPFPVVAAGQTNWNGWIPFPVFPVGAKNGFNDITLGEGNNLSSLLVLSDNWLLCRYRGFTNDTPTEWSDWVGAPGGEGAMLAQGWIKRVIAGLNEFDSRVRDFHQAPAATYASMILQAGERYEGPIAFNPDPNYLNQLGLIESYETVLERGRKLSIDGLPAVNFGPANDALLRAAGKIADLYMLLGNEAFADASDPTIGFTTSSGEYGNLAPSIFCFQNQLDSPLEEELALLRGRDNTSMGVRARPIYNRLIWNFTLGDGEVAYKLTYNISDQNKDGFIDEKDGRTLYPQGHGDAWGHYLTATKKYYQLLRHPFYEWVPRPEAVTVAGSPVQVDYLDERKFAKAAAAKAKAGAEIVNLTYRQKYVENPSGQWQGYKDTDADRGWGVDDWARRTGTAAYFDWVVANAILPSVDPNTNHTGIQKIDRTTVTELGEIPSQFATMEAQMDTVDRGLNPLGLAAGAMPFDIDPSKVSTGQTHFDQIYQRALKAMENSLALFDHANALSQNLRRNQDSVEEFAARVDDQERDYKNRLIEIFGYPFAGDIGPSGAYPSGYDGPDTVHFMYVNASDLTGDKTQPGTVLTTYFKPLILGEDSMKYMDSPALPGAGEIFTVNYPLVEDGFYKFQAPSQWGQRRAPGKAQTAIGEMLKVKANLNLALVEYQNLVEQIQDEMDLLEKYIDTTRMKLWTQRAEKTTLIGLSAWLMSARASADAIKLTAKAIDDNADAAVEAMPKVVGLANDALAPARGAVKRVRTAVTWPMHITGTIANKSVARLEEAKEMVRDATAFALTEMDVGYERDQKVRALEQLIREEVPKRIEVYTLRDELQRSFEAYLSIVAEGQRLQDERYEFRAKTAARIQEHRYQDMAFRIFQNDALQKYRAQFDLAARYVYLAAKAYDYETCLLNTETGAGARLLTDIVRQRTLGQVVNGQPVSGRHGLADPLARLGQNFEVYRGQLGFTTPETETGRFSLRSELFRVRPGDLQTNLLNGLISTNRDWQALLQQCRVPDLWKIQEFRRFCRPFAPESAGPQPGLVIRIPTTINFGLNYFGWPLGPGDSAYDSSRFATKVRSAGVWFQDYSLAGLSMTPRVYLVPAGTDILRSPSSYDLETREFNVLDQKLPVPFPVGATDLRNPGWIPVNDSLSETFGDIRRFSSFRAYHDKGWFDENEATQDTRLIGRSVWNTQWLLIIPGGTFLYDPNRGLDTFIATVSDIKIFFQTYSYSGN